MSARWQVEECGTLTRVAARDCLRGGRGTDLSARTEWPLAELPRDAARFRRAIADQVRQDLWRLLRRIRGFLPVVEVEVEVEAGGGLLRVMAGGVVSGGRAPAGTEEAVATLVSGRANRLRWMAQAYRKGGRAT